MRDSILIPIVLALFLTALLPLPAFSASLDDTPIRQARLYEKQGNYQQASDMYLMTARILGAAEGEKWKVKAAEMAWRAGNVAQAESILDETDETRLDHVTLVHARLVAARIARSKGDFARVLQKLDFPSHSAPARLQRAITALLDEAREKVGFQRPAGNGAPAAPPARPGALGGAVRASGTWSRLMALSTQELAKRLGQPLSPIEKGWTELAYIAKSAGDDPQALENQLARWERQYRNHPAYPDYVNALRPGKVVRSGNELAGQPRRVAVLLPTSGPLAKVASVILEGIMAAKFRYPDMAIQVYDTNAADIRSLYRQAVDAGAELVIGPMDKSQVDALTAETLDVPVIALNYGKDHSLANPLLFQFSLAPEDEARNAARRMLADGHSRVAALAPEGGWGDRIIAALKDELTANGGELVAVGRFKPRGNDHSNVIKRALKPNARTHVNGVDADAVFFAASPKQARLLMPLIKFHFIHSLPAYATSHAWSGFPERAANRDLNRLTITEIPWLLGDAPESAPRPAELDDTARHHPRLFAFGYDALTAVPALIQDGRAQGLSGILTLDDRNRIHRELGFARFRRGQAKPLHRAGTLPATTTAPAPAPDLVPEPALNALPFKE